jgi:hypothetical protein
MSIPLTNRPTNYFPEPESLSSSVMTRGALITYDGRWPEIQYGMKPPRSHSGSRADPRVSEWKARFDFGIRGQI